MKKEELNRLLDELDLTPDIVDVLDNDILLEDLVGAGYSYTQAKRTMDKGIKSGKLQKLYAVINGKRTNVYRTVK